jgi:biopolymer transport protein ExbB
MNIKMMKSAIVAATVSSVIAFSAGTVSAQEAKTLDQLLGFVKQGQATEAKENKAREARFKAAKNKQASMLADANRQRVQEEKRSASLESTFEKNELAVADKQRQLKERLGTLTELFGHLTSTAGDMRSNFDTSLVSVQYPGRDVFLDEMIAKMSGAEQLPSIEEIERMWFEIQREMIEGGKIVSFTADVAKPGGEK